MILGLIAGAVGVSSFVWLPLAGRALTAAVYGRGTWDRMMAEDEPGEFGPYVPRWRGPAPSGAGDEAASGGGSS